MANLYIVLNADVHYYSITTNATETGPHNGIELALLCLQSLAILYIHYYDRLYFCGWQNTCGNALDQKN